MSAGHRARKRFGQHFLEAPNVVDDIVAAIGADGDDTLVEIGPGHGAITQALADSGATLHAIEFDRDLVPRLRARFASRPRVTIHEADALSFDYASLGRELRIVGNLPYNISTPLLFALIGYKNHLRDLHLMLQKEVVDRMAAHPGSKAYGRLSIMLACHLDVVPLFDVSPDSFTPPPKVVSTVVALRPLPPGTYDINDVDALSALVATAFSRRRKTVRNALKGVADERLLGEASIDPSSRPEQIAVQQWIDLGNLLQSARDSS